MGINEVFNQAAERVKQLNEASDEAKLDLYGWFKQATQGDCSTSKFEQSRSNLLGACLTIPSIIPRYLHSLVFVLKLRPTWRPLQC